MKVRSGGLEETKKLAAEFVQSLVPREDGATVVGLHGDLGSAKTTFAQFVAEILGVTEHVTSPTFVIIKSYKLSTFSDSPSESRILDSAEQNRDNFQLLTHIDAYRLKNADELRALGFETLLSNPRNLIFIEWPERVSEILPKTTIPIQFLFINESSRDIDIESHSK